MLYADAHSKLEPVLVRPIKGEASCRSGSTDEVGLEQLRAIIEFMHVIGVTGDLDAVDSCGLEIDPGAALEALEPFTVHRKGGYAAGFADLTERYSRIARFDAWRDGRPVKIHVVGNANTCRNAGAVIIGDQRLRCADEGNCPGRIGFELRYADLTVKDNSGGGFGAAIDRTGPHCAFGGSTQHNVCVEIGVIHRRADHGVIAGEQLYAACQDVSVILRLGQLISGHRSPAAVHQTACEIDREVFRHRALLDVGDFITIGQSQIVDRQRLGVARQSDLCCLERIAKSGDGSAHAFTVGNGEPVVVEVHQIVVALRSQCPHSCFRNRCKANKCTLDGICRSEVERVEIAQGTVGPILVEQLSIGRLHGIGTIYRSGIARRQDFQQHRICLVSEALAEDRGDRSVGKRADCVAITIDDTASGSQDGVLCAIAVHGLGDAVTKRHYAADADFAGDIERVGRAARAEIDQQG